MACSTIWSKSASRRASVSCLESFRPATGQGHGSAHAAATTGGLVEADQRGQALLHGPTLDLSADERSVEREPELIIGVVATVRRRAPAPGGRRHDERD